MLVKRKRHSGPEQRRSPRRNLGVAVGIDLGNGEPAHRCVLSDVSESGAKLSGVTVPELQDEFDLLLAGERGPRRRVQVVWRTDARVGVRFVQPEG